MNEPELFAFTEFEQCAECLASEPGNILERLVACRDYFLTADEAATLPPELRRYWFLIADELLEAESLGDAEDAILLARNIARFSAVSRDEYAHRVYARNKT